MCNIREYSVQCERNGILLSEEKKTIEKWYVCLGSNHIHNWQFICRNDAKIWHRFFFFFFQNKRKRPEHGLSPNTIFTSNVAVACFTLIRNVMPLEKCESFECVKQRKRKKKNWQAESFTESVCWAQEGTENKWELT